MPSNNTSILTREILNAYLEMVAGILTMRRPDVQKVIHGSVGTYAVSSSYKELDLIIDVCDMAKNMEVEGLENVASLKKSFLGVNSIFLIAVWDILQDHAQYPKVCNKPEVQFLRHVRNGCGHGNSLNFDHIEKPAKWRDKEITDLMQGLKVFPDLMKDGDPILLVFDINNKFFQPVDI